MSTLREKIVAVLNTDAALDTSGTLGLYLGKSETAPHGIFFMAPPETPDVPFITYNFLGDTEDFTNDLYLGFTVYSDNFVAIIKRLKVLLSGTDIKSTEERVLLCKYDWGGPDLWDDNLKCYAKHVRFLIKVKE